MVVSAEKARAIVYEDDLDFVQVEADVVDTSRWSIHYEGVFKHKESGKYYWVGWSVGATEMQDEAPFEYESEVDLIEVKEVEIVAYEWKPVNEEI